MRLVLDKDPGILLVHSYDSAGVQVGKERLTRSFLLARDCLQRDWAPRDLSELDAEALAALLRLSPRIVLLGQSAGSALVPGPLRRQFAARGIALEALELGAA